jgi:hypothetical protein
MIKANILSALGMQLSLAAIGYAGLPTRNVGTIHGAMRLRPGFVLLGEAR